MEVPDAFDNPFLEQKSIRVCKKNQRDFWENSLTNNPALPFIYRTEIDTFYQRIHELRITSRQLLMTVTLQRLEYGSRDTGDRVVAGQPDAAGSFKSKSLVDDFYYCSQLRIMFRVA